MHPVAGAWCQDALMRGAGLVWVALLITGCSSTKDGAAPTTTDAGATAEAGPFAACTTDPQAVTTHGIAAELDATCTASLPSDYHVCLMGRDDLCTTTDLLSAWSLTGVPNAEVAFRITRNGSIPRLKPAHPFGCTFDSQVFALPTPAVMDKLLEGQGGFAQDKAYLLVYAEKKLVPGTAPLPNACTDQVEGFTVTTSRGQVLYPDATGLTVDPAATATTTSGLAVVVVDKAAALTAPETIRVTATRAGDAPACHIVEGQNWDRSPAPTPGKTELAADAPAVAGHVTYALWTLCDR
jgi:hypothetical protein